MQDGETTAVSVAAALKASKVTVERLAFLPHLATPSLANPPPASAVC